VAYTNQWGYSRGVQRVPFRSSLPSDSRPSRYRQRRIPIQTPIVGFAVLEPQRFALLLQSSPPYSNDPQFERDSERNYLTEDIIEACECLEAWWKKKFIQQQKDYGGSELCGSEVDSFNNRVSNKVIGNGNGNSSTARAKFVHGVVRAYFISYFGNLLCFIASRALASPQ
jgi:hypothetical protein